MLDMVWVCVDRTTGIVIALSHWSKWGSGEKPGWVDDPELGVRRDWASHYAEANPFVPKGFRCFGNYVLGMAGTTNRKVEDKLGHLLTHTTHQSRVVE